MSELHLLLRNRIDKDYCVYCEDYTGQLCDKECITRKNERLDRDWRKMHGMEFYCNECEQETDSCSRGCVYS